MSFDQRIMYKKAILMYKSINEPSFPIYMKNKFQTINDKHDFNLRSIQNEKLTVPKPKTEFFRKSFNYSGPVVWNSIPIHIRNSDTLRKFQSSYIQWQFSN